MPKMELLFDVLNPEVYPHAAADAAREISFEYDLPVTYVKAIRNHNGSQETVHVFHDSELQLFPARALRSGDSGEIAAAARRLLLVHMN